MHHLLSLAQSTHAAAPHGASYIYVSFCALSLALGALIYSLSSVLLLLSRSNHDKQEPVSERGSGHDGAAGSIAHL